MTNATKAYEAKRKEVDAMIAKLQQQLVKMDAEQAAKPRDYGFAGSAGYVAEQLNNALVHLTGEDA